MTDNQEKRDYLLKRLGEFLMNHNFKKKGFTFKRETEKDFIQIIELGLGPSWTTKAGEVNLGFGVFSTEWHKYFASWKLPSTIRSADCEIRECYCNIIEKNQNHNWFDLSNNLDALIGHITNELNMTILPLLDQLKTRNDVISLYVKHGERIGLPPRHKISIAILYYGIGDYETSLKLAQEEYSNNSKNPFYERVFNNLSTDISKSNA